MARLPTESELRLALILFVVSLEARRFERLLVACQGDAGEATRVYDAIRGRERADHLTRERAPHPMPAPVPAPPWTDAGSGEFEGVGVA